MNSITSQYDRKIETRFSRRIYLGGLMAALLLLGGGPALSSPAQVADRVLPNLGCISTEGQPGTLGAFAAGMLPMALFLPVQRQGQLVKTFDVHLHAVWLPDPLRQAEAIASSGPQRCLVVIGSDGRINDVIDQPKTARYMGTFKPLN